MMKLLALYSFMLLIFPIISHMVVEADGGNYYEKCKGLFQCGGSKANLSYPFYDGQTRPQYCGYPGFQIDCSNAFPEITMASETYYLFSMDANSDTASVARKDFWNGLFCPQMSLDNDINSTLYQYASTKDSLTLFYNCSATVPMYSAYQFNCNNTNIYNNEVGYLILTRYPDFPQAELYYTCHSNVQVPVQSQNLSISNDANNFKDGFHHPFGLQWTAENKLCDSCRNSGGVCGYNNTLTRIACYCPDGSLESDCSGSSPHNVHRIVGVTLACLAIGLGVIFLLAYYLKRRYFTDKQAIDGVLTKYGLPGTRRRYSPNINDFLKKYGSLATKRYTYSSLKKMTNSFKYKLGEGGYGVVYKGKLLNGRLVAVKLLQESKGNAEEFINEVTSIGSTNHVNIVTLLGFCFEGRRRALVYDFMPNGSLENFIYAKNNYQQSLAWDMLFQIAVGIARGLEYLHRGCNTRIVHFDIKPHNILLDETFCPKISDFGLAKPWHQNDSIISLSGARGTVGFIAPEVYLKSFGGVSHKSDVYSYGMLVLDMVGRRKNVNAEVQNSSEQYFPDWIYKQLEQTEELGHQDILIEEEKGTLRKMILVSLWCIQTNPSTRPPMTRVVEMLEGPLESLQIPPTPTLFSPPISQSNSTIAAIISSSTTTQIDSEEQKKQIPQA